MCQTETINKKGTKSSPNGCPRFDRPLKPEELAEMNVEDLMKENLKIYGKKLEITSKRHLGVALYDSC